MYKCVHVQYTYYLLNLSFQVHQLLSLSITELVSLLCVILTSYVHNTSESACPPPLSLYLCLSTHVCMCVLCVTVCVCVCERERVCVCVCTDTCR